MRRTGTAALVLLLCTLAACGSDPEDREGTTLTVFAGSSLTATFTRLGARFEAEHPGVEVSLSFGGSSDLVAQIRQGAPADVFAAADTATMREAVAAKAVQGTPVDFASNTLEIAVPPDNPARVATLQDLAEEGTQVVLCAPEVPCGAAAQKVEKAAGVTIRPVSEEQAVTDVLTKVGSGEADAGLVYVTDVEAAGAKVQGVRFPESSAVVNTYPVAVLSASRHRGLAAEFVDLVTGPDGQAVLRDAGFAKPPA